MRDNIKINLKKELKGSILDIGGGGEGIIGRLYTNQVTAIDNRQDEIDEAPNCCRIILMDATDLKFEDGTFDNITFFYSLMYMNEEVKKKSLLEAFRVLKKGGSLCIWDAEIENIYPNPFFVNLDICFENKKIHTTYGIVKNESQTVDKIKGYLENSGFTFVFSEISESTFYLTYCK